MKSQKRLVTAALPYVNNVPHLGNLIQVLSADVYARYCRSTGFETIYVCGTDEYGTATETKALALGRTPQDLCDEYHVVHKEIYDWFNIQFDIFGRTSSPEQTEIVQALFLELDKAGYITSLSTQQFFCETCDRFLADRFIEGTCPHCAYNKAKGDQCDNCGQLLDPIELINPHCTTCGSAPVLRSTKNLYIDLPKLEKALVKWLDDSNIESTWASNAVRVTRNWIKNGLHERAITRDLKWGIAVPKAGYEDKVFYVWFDAPIGYISLTKGLTANWKNWWNSPEDTKLVQFVGKDNIPFHSILFPSVLLGTDEKWTMVNQLASTEYLNYENTKFSKSNNIGIFGDDAKDTGIPADVWRYYLMAHRPEKADTSFLWHDFQERINADLIGNFGNFINRTLSFYEKFFGTEIDTLDEMSEIWSGVRTKEVLALQALEATELKTALAYILSIADQANKQIQENAPWKTIKEDPVSTKRFLTNWVYVIRNLAILIEPYMPTSSTKILGMLGLSKLTFKDLEELTGIKAISKPEILFEKLESEQINSFREQYGTKGDKKMEEQEPKKAPKKNIAPIEPEFFDQKVAMTVMQITNVEKHPEADKLFIISLKEDEAGEITRTIVSGLVGIYTEEDLINQKIVVVANLKKSKLRGVVSEGMLNAVEPEGDHSTCEILIADENIPLGTRLVTEERIHAELTEAPSLKPEKFFAVELTAKDGKIFADGKQLFFHGAGMPVTVKKILNGFVR